VITALHHVAIAVRDLDAAAVAYQRLLGHTLRWIEGGGARRAWFDLANMSLELIASEGDGPSGERLRAWLADHDEGIWALAFTTPDLEGATRLAERRGLAVSERVPGATLIDPAATAGLQVILTDKPRPALASTEPAAVAALDHVVVTTPNPDRALAIYGAKLGLDLRLDRSNPAWGARQMFLACGETVVEIGASLKAPVSDGHDRFGGLAWRVADAPAARARIAAAGFDVSEVRTGRKPGTEVFTLRSGVPGAPALLISQGVRPLDAAASEAKTA
jgi:catechol 2,3-dioxygenase-like lactoylglutathione lyase family enzyme